jgi:hypothetical protein
MISVATRRIDISVTGAGITTPPTATIIFPETEVELAASAGPDRILRFTEFDVNGNLLKQSYIRLPVLTAAGSAWTTGATQQYGAFYLGDQHYGENQQPGSAWQLPTDGSWTQVQVLDMTEPLDLSSSPPVYETQEWYYFDVPSGVRQWVTLTMSSIEQFINGSGPTNLSIAVTTDGQYPVGLGALGEPVGVLNPILINGTPPVVTGIMADEPPIPAPGEPALGQQTLEAFLPQGRYFVRVCFITVPPNQLSDDVFGLSPADTTDLGPVKGGKLGYRLSIQFGQLAGAGGVTN